MAKYEVITARAGGNSYVLPSSQFLHIGGSFTALESTEANVKVKLYDSYIAADFIINITANTASAIATIRIRKNGANGNGVISVGTGVTGILEDTSNSDSFVNGDDINYAFTAPGASSGSVTFTSIGITLAHNTTDTTVLVTLADAETAAAGATTYHAIGGRGLGNPTEANTQYIMRDTTTLKQLRCYISANTSTNSTTLTLRKNGADTSVTITIGAGVTGALEDTTNTASIAVGDKVNYKFVGPSSGNTHAFELIQITSLSSKRQYISSHGGAGGISFSDNSTAYYVCLEALLERITSEANTKYKLRISTAASALQVNVVTNSRVTGTVVTFRKNGAASELTFTIAAGATGILEDASNTVALAPGDLVNFEVKTSTGGGVLIFQQMGCTLQNSSGFYVIIVD